MESSERAYLALLAQQLKSAIGHGTGKRERAVLKVARALEEIVQK